MVIFNLDTPVSSCDSVFSQFSVLSWERGIANFFIESVPFSWSNGHIFGNQIVAYLQLLSQHFLLESDLSCYEFGSGLGRLFPYVALQMKNDPSGRGFKFYSSDSSQRIIDELSHSLSSDHYCSVQFDQMSFDSFQFSEQQAPHFLVMSFLLQSLSHCYLIWDNGELKEEKVITRLSGQPLLDTSVCPFQWIESDDILNWISEQEPDVILSHLSRLKLCFTEEWILDSCTCLSQEERILLDAYFVEMQISYCRFNYQKTVITGLKNLFENAPDTCLWVIQDVGDIGVEGIPGDSKRIDSYGVYQCSYVYFPLIRYIAEKFNFGVCSTSFSNSEIQQLIFYRGIPSAAMNECFSQFQQVPFLSQEKQFKQSIDQAALFLSGQAFKDKVLTVVNGVVPGALSYDMGMLIAEYFYCKQDYLEALHYTTAVIHDYADFAVTAKLLQSKCYIAMNQFDKASQLLNQMIKVTSFFPDLYFYLSIVCIKTKNYDGFIDAMKRYLMCVQSDIDWNHVFTFLIVLAYHLPDKQQFEGYLAEINLCIKHQYYDIPDDVVTRFSEFELEYSHLV